MRFYKLKQDSENRYTKKGLTVVVQCLEDFNLPLPSKVWEAHNDGPFKERSFNQVVFSKSTSTELSAIDCTDFEDAKTYVSSKFTEALLGNIYQSKNLVGIRLLFLGEDGKFLGFIKVYTIKHRGLNKYAADVYDHRGTKVLSKIMTMTLESLYTRAQDRFIEKLPARNLISATTVLD